MTTKSQLPNNDVELEDLNLNSPLNFNNFQVDDIDMGETVNVTILIDNSGSMSGYKDILNEEINMMIDTWQKWHHAPKIFLSIGTFGSTIEVITGFQPIINVKPHVFNPNESSTKLYDGCKEFLKNIIKQQQDAMKAGIQTKNIFFVLTDGADNDSNYDSANEIKKMISVVLKDEQTMGSFGAVMCGIGEPSVFEKAKDNMGFQKLFTIDPSLTEKENAKRLKEMFGRLSTSVSSASSMPGSLINF